MSPEISVSPAMTVTEGGSAVLECNVTAANPSATVTWRSPSNAVIPHTNGRLRLPMINRNQHGSYTCWASNGVGSATSKTTSITINCKLHWFFLVSTSVMQIITMFNIGKYFQRLRVICPNLFENVAGIYMLLSQYMNKAKVIRISDRNSIAMLENFGFLHKDKFF